MRPTPPPRDDRAPTCPDWCRRDHDAGDGVDDLLHQSDPAHVAVVHGEPRFATRENAWPDAVVLRLAQRPGSTTVWLEASSEEGRALHVLVTAESAQRLAAAMIALLSVL